MYSQVLIAGPKAYFNTLQDDIVRIKIAQAA